MKALVTILVGFLISMSAQAGFLAEPWLGYESGKVECSTILNQDCSATSTGANFGLRLGWMHSAGFWVAGEYMAGSGDLKFDGSTTSDSFERTVTAATLGYDFPMGFRMFAGYGFSANFKEKFTGVNFTFKGTSSRIGLGYKFHNNLTVNLEYHMDSLNKLDILTLTDLNVSDIYSKMNSTRTMLTVSYAFNSGK